VQIQGAKKLTPVVGLCYVCFIKPICVAAAVRIQRLVLSIGPN
jgi:hypothetical protein